ncbi:signal peptidase I [Agromyces sp. MMS24-K17]|uniref:signal peptidase I n=1 Tax=Agromyces sp. MMS24-K17 TaxID=3372850 RepID=UPI00375437E0
MRALTAGTRLAGEILLWVVAGVGVLSGLVWVGHLAGWVQPLVVVSGSMEPEIRRGDLLVAIPTPATELVVGDVASLHNEVTDRLVTHRVVATSRVGAEVLLELKGDANAVVDPAPYRLAADAMAWRPIVTLPGAGDVVLALARPNVAIPLAIAVLALISLSLVPRHPPARHLAARGDTV